METKIRYQMDIQGMTCTDCERHVAHALQKAGAENITANFRQGRAVFWAPKDFAIAYAQDLVKEAGYRPMAVTVLGDSDPAMTASPEDHDFDLIIIGSGSAGFAAAIEARQAGARVLMVERDIIGGTCVNIGCVPSKTLIRAAELHHSAQHNPFAGLHTGAEPPDLARLVTDKDELVSSLRKKKYEDLLAEYGIDFMAGEAHFVDERRVAVNDRVVAGARYLIATGARPYVPPLTGLKTIPYLTSTSALNLTTIPDHLIVVGSGYIALELGQMFRRWGSQVTLIQRSTTLMPHYDPEVRLVIAKMLEDEGIQVITGARYDRIEQAGAVTRLMIEVDGRQTVVEGDQVLVAAGRIPNTEALQLETAGVHLGPKGEPIVDATLMTTNPRIYAAGDVTLGPQFVYVAAYEGKAAAQNALGLRQPHTAVELNVVPSVIFTQPAIATVGLTETAAQQQGLAIKSAVLPLDAVTRALANRETRGLFKMVADDETGRIRGVQVVADNAGEVIYAATLAVKFGLTVSDLTETLAPYLTMAEGLKLTALTFNKDVDKLSCCAG